MKSLLPVLNDYIRSQEAVDLALQFLIVLIAILLFFVIILAIIVLGLRVKNNRRARFWNRVEERWTKHLYDYLSDDEPEWTIPIQKKERLYFLQFLLRMTYRLQGQEREKLVQLAQPYLAPLVKRTTHSSAEVRARAIQTLGVFGLPQYDEAILKALEDSSPVVSMLAARTLANTRNPKYCPSILSILHRFSFWSMNYLSSMLTAFGPDIIPDLEKTYGNPREPVRVRIACCEALRELNSLTASPIAEAVIREDADPDLTAASLRLLKETGTDRQADVVRQLLDSDHFILRAHAISALAALGDERDFPRLEAALNDNSNWVAIHAARALKALGGEAILEKISHSAHPRAMMARQQLRELEV
ncbi:MAG: hypothetical protein D6762_01920 [Candidatus Neomarinimicrobiota bacterium]|nr:MAG: hypothetical protein D6762_01920 [Candidatus Neomarinimicrobiota bacterium]